MISAFVRRQRILNGTLTGLMLVAGLAMLAYASITILSAVSTDLPHQKSFAATLEQRCTAAVAEAGYQYSMGANKEIVAKGRSLDDAYRQLSNASLAIQQCLGYDMNSFCMGSGCAGGDITFTLKMQESAR